MPKPLAGPIALAGVLLLVAATASAQGPHRAPGGRGERLAQGPWQESKPAQLVAEPEPRVPRLTAEERRQLRRDVHDAGRDLYREETRERRRAARRGE